MIVCSILLRMRKINHILFILFNIFFISILNANEWQLQINIENIYNSSTPGDWISLGTCDGCSDGFQYSEDEYDTPDGPIDYTDIQFTNYSWIGVIDSNGIFCESPHFASDNKSTHEPSDLLIWNITGICADEVEESTQTTQLNWMLDSLDQDYEIFIYVGEEGTNMRYTTAINVSCEEMESNYEFIDGEWVANSNIKVLMGGCAISGLDTFYWDEDGDGLGSSLFSEYCNGFEPEGWVENNEDLDDSSYCESNNFDECWVCDGDNYLMDCNQVCSPETPTGQDQLGNGLVYGAFYDSCNICSGGSTNHIENSDQDCAEVCFGDAFYDDCDICSGGSTNHAENSDQDCAGNCSGDAVYDSCGECDGQNYSCLDQIFGNGPSDLYAQINLESEEIYLTWNYNDISSEVLGYFIWEHSNEIYNLITQIESSETLSNTISGFTSGTFCVSAYDEYQNESSKTCTESSEFSNYNFILNEPSSSYLISFPYLSNDDNGVETIFGPISQYVEKIVGEGISAIYNNGVWAGSLQELERKRGYWIMTNDDFSDPITLSVSGIPTDPSTVYSLHDNANLISYIGPNDVLVSDALPDDIEHMFYGIINQGQAAILIDGTWHGSLVDFKVGMGYWVMVSEEFSPIDLVWNLDNNQESNNGTDSRKTHRVSPFHFNQSTLQSFYFVTDIDATTFNLDEDDIIISYCNQMIVGSRYYNQGHPDIPAMGYDGTNTIGYCLESNTPNFKIYDSETGRLINLYGDNIPGWRNLGINKITLTDLSSTIIPDKTDIISTYPNPFNPSTKIELNLDEHQNIVLSIYDIRGKLVQTLVDRNLDSGSHSFTWSPNNLSSGVYIITLQTNLEVKTNKILYLK